MTLSSLDAWGYGLADDDGTITLRPTWDDALALVNRGGDFWFVGQEYLLRRMMRLEPVASAFRLFQNLVCEGKHEIGGAVGEPVSKVSGEKPPLSDRQTYKRSEEALAFTQGWASKLPYSLKDLCGDLCEAWPYGNKLAEIDYQPFALDSAPFKGVVNYVAPVDVAPKPRTVYDYVVTRGNVVVGVKAINAPDSPVVPSTNLVCLGVGGMDRDPRGMPILATLYRLCESYQRDEVNEEKASDQLGGGFLVASQKTPTSGTYDPTIDVPSGTKNPDGSDRLVKMSKVRYTGQAVAKAKTGTVVTLPPDTELTALQADGAAIFGQFIERKERAIYRAFLGAARAVLEAQNGSKADSESAGGVAETMRDAARGRLCATLQNLFRTVLRLNFGDKYDDVVPTYTITTEEGDQFAAIVNVMVQPGFAALPSEIKTAIGTKAGFPPFPEQEEADPNAAAKDDGDGTDPENPKEDAAEGD